MNLLDKEYSAFAKCISWCVKGTGKQNAFFNTYRKLLATKRQQLWLINEILLPLAFSHTLQGSELYFY